MPHAMYEVGRGSVHAATYAAHKSQCTLFRYWPVSKAFRIAISGSPSLFGDQEDRRYAQPALVRKESVMHLPEQPGRAGELSAFGGDLGMRMHFGQEEMTEDDPHPPAKMPLHLVDHGMRQRALADALACAIAAVFPRDVALGFEIGEQWEMQVTVTGEGGMAPHPLDRNAQ